MRRLSGMDASFLAAETPAWHMHAGSLVIVDPSTAPVAFDVARFRELVAARIGALAPLRRRHVGVPLGLDRGVWVDTSDVDLERHVQRVLVARPGGPRELGALVGSIWERQLDRDRPLWEISFIEGLAGGRIGLLLKAHHSVADGERGARLYGLLLDLSPDAPLTPVTTTRSSRSAVPDERVPSGIELALRSIPDLLATPVRAAQTAAGLARAGWRVAGVLASDGVKRATFPFQAPRTSINRRVTPRREFAYCSVPLDAVLDIRHAFGVTVNDVVLAICGGALRRHLDARGELPERPLIAQVPVAVHVGDPLDTSDSAWGNQVTVMGASLGTEIADPVARLAAVHTSTASGKSMQAALGEDLILDLARVAPPAVLGAGVCAYTRLHLADHHPPVFNLIVSNVRGPGIPTYIAGARVVGNHPIGPLLDGSGLNVTVCSQGGSVDFGFIACPEVVADLWSLVDATAEAFAELRDAAADTTAKPAADTTAKPAADTTADSSTARRSPAHVSLAGNGRSRAARTPA